MENLQFLSSFSWRRPSWTRVFAFFLVLTSTSSGPCSLPALCTFCCHVSLSSFTLSLSSGSWACSSAKAFSWFAVSISLVLIACTLIVNCCPFVCVFSSITFIHRSSCSMTFFVLWLSAVITMSPLSSFCAANAFHALVERVALIDSTRLPLVYVSNSSTTFIWLSKVPYGFIVEPSSHPPKALNISHPRNPFAVGPAIEWCVHVPCQRYQKSLSPLPLSSSVQSRRQIIHQKSAGYCGAVGVRLRAP